MWLHASIFDVLAEVLGRLSRLARLKWGGDILWRKKLRC